jgi:hypothetical protein
MPGTTLAASVSSTKFWLSSCVRVITDTDCGVSLAVSSVLVAAPAEVAAYESKPSVWPSRTAAAVTRTSLSELVWRASTRRSSQPPWGWAMASSPLPASRRCSASPGSIRPCTAGAMRPVSSALSAAMLVPVARASALMASGSGWAGRSMATGAAWASVAARAAAQASADRRARAGSRKAAERVWRGMAKILQVCWCVCLPV